MAELQPYLHFNGKAKEAMEFYKDVFGGELEMSTVGESPMADQNPDTKDNIMHSTLRSGDVVFMASDMMDESEMIPGNRVELCLNCTSEDEIKNLFAKLADGGKVNSPLKTEFWGATFGQLEDKFGINWMLNYDKPKA